ncbi:hypothetical protein GE09DRAFT_1136146 [Coniochaeta sp. 2T2.1]|nr:hypothetical protein GE09DRAFT_1136146 [Coniochaeta sp. 2T2.1]
MISEVEKLCKYGARFGLLNVEDQEVQDSLRFLRARLHDMAQCPNRGLPYESSSSDDGG